MTEEARPQMDAVAGHAGEQPPSYWRGDARESGEPRADYYRSEPNAEPSAERRRQAYAAQAEKQKDHICAGLLAIVLGMFGIHKFYLGYNSTGFVMLAVSVLGGMCTLGLAAVVIGLISVVEGIIYLCKSQTDFEQIYVLNERDWF